MRSGVDPKYEDEVSGCTACVGLITDDKIFIVGLTLQRPRVYLARIPVRMRMC